MEATAAPAAATTTTTATASATALAAEEEEKEWGRRVLEGWWWWGQDAEHMRWVRLRGAEGAGTCAPARALVRVRELGRGLVAGVLAASD